MNEGGEKTAKPGLMRRWFGGSAAPAEAEAPTAPSEAPVAIPEPPAVGLPAAAAPKRSWLQRLRFGLSRSSSSIGRGITDIFTKRKLDAASLDDLEDVLIQADLGLGAATRIREAIARGRYEKGIDPDEVRAVLAAEVERTLIPVARPLEHRPGQKAVRRPRRRRQRLGQDDDDRQARRQIRRRRPEGDRWPQATRSAPRRSSSCGSGRDAPVPISSERDQGADAAGLAFDALTRARAENADVVLMDTAGRLQNRAELMGELEKIIRVMKKVDASAPHAVLLVLDATVGQNALNQVEIFGRTAGVTGLVMTKLDGTARGGILVAIAEKFALPVHFIGVGEGVDDLEPFAARDFAEAIAGIESADA